MERKRSKLFNELVIKSWWVILFFLSSIFAYDQAMLRKKREEKDLRAKLEDIRMAIAKGASLKEDLEMRIASQNDPLWTELVLMRKLGLVPEKQTKIFFIPKKLL